MDTTKSDISRTPSKRMLWALPAVLILVAMFVFESCNQKPSGPSGDGDHTGGATGGAPAVSGLAPTSGPDGTAVTIRGSGFSATASANTVTFGGSEAIVTTVASDSLVAVVPDGLSPGSVSLEVTTDGQTATGPDFTVTAPAAGTIASDGFETGDLSGSANEKLTWSGTYTGGGADVAVTQTNPHEGAYSVEFTYPSTDTRKYAELFPDFGKEYKELWVSFWIYFPDGTEGWNTAKYAQLEPSGKVNNSLFMFGDAANTGGPQVGGPEAGPGNTGALVGLFAGRGPLYGFDGSEDQAYAKLTYRDGGNFGYAWKPQVQTDDGSADLANNDLRGQWNHLVIHMKTQSAPDANDERVQVWYNGTLYYDARDNINMAPASYEEGNFFSGGILMGGFGDKFASQTKVWVDDVQLAASDVWGVQQ